jgi:DnaK suppressor protein
MNSRELQHYRGLLLPLRERLTEAIARMSETVRTDARPAGEHDQLVSESPDAELLLEQDEEAIRRQVLDALKRIDAGMYGRCQKCGHRIAPARLDAVPYTPFCIGCERKLEAVT